jgi:hypothetical protein
MDEGQTLQWQKKDKGTNKDLQNISPKTTY